jgi:hypothetical protein
MAGRDELVQPVQEAGARPRPRSQRSPLRPRLLRPTARARNVRVKIMTHPTAAPQCIIATSPACATCRRSERHRSPRPSATLRHAPSRTQLEAARRPQNYRRAGPGAPSPSSRVAAPTWASCSSSCESASSLSGRTAERERTDVLDARMSASLLRACLRPSLHRLFVREDEEDLDVEPARFIRRNHVLEPLPWLLSEPS